MNASCLELSPEEMRRFGYRVIDLLVDHFAQMKEGPVGAKAAPEIIRPQFARPAPENPVPVEESLDFLARHVFTNVLHVDHPRFFAFVPSPNNFASTMADALASGFNVFNGSWLGGSAAAALELVVIDWLREFCALPKEAGGLFVSGGSMANTTALMVARHARLQDRFEPATVYFSDQTHSSVERGLRVLGFLPEQMRKIQSDADFRLPLNHLSAQIADDRAAGLRPFCIIANAGTTNTGAVDPLPELADLAAREDLWLHADGAYGAAAIISERSHEALRGLDRVDSLSLDPHKWLFQSFECGCVLVRDAQLMKTAFQIHPDYLQDVHRNLVEVNPCDYGIQLTRSFRALKVWLSIHTFGMQAFRNAILRGFELAEFAEQQLRTLSGWEILSPARMGIVCFRYVPQSGDVNALQLQLMETMLRDQFALLTTTVLRGETVLRMCTINPRTTESDIVETLRRLDAFARESQKSTSMP